MSGRPGFGLAILALPVAAGACNAGGAPAPAPASAAPAEAGCPAPSWGNRADGARLPVERVWNRLSVDRGGAVYWNGRPIDAATLSQFVDLIPTLNPVPETDMEVDPDAPCEAVARVVRVVGSGIDCSRLCHYAVKPWRAEAVPRRH